MNPIKHPSNNARLTPPPGITEEQCVTLHITRVSHQHPTQPDKLMAGVISYWQPSPEELAALNAGNPLFLSFWGATHPPVAVGVEAIAPEADEPWTRNNERTLTLIYLCGGHSVPASAIAAWSDAECQAAEEWAAREHLHASDNDEVERVPMPACIRAHPYNPNHAADVLRPHGSVWDPNPDGIRPDQQSLIRMDESTGDWIGIPEPAEGDDA